MMKKWLDTVLDIIYPPQCPSCRKQVDRAGKWCDDCFESILKIDNQIKTSPEEYCVKYVDEWFAVCSYQGIVRSLILDMKFNKNKKPGLSLAYILEQCLQGVYKSKVDFVVPVPLYVEKLKERGFNQTEVIFKPWTEKEGLAWLDCLERIRLTNPQWKLTAKEREENVKGAFSMTRLFETRHYVEGKTILLVDDIFTSGNTIKECAKVLKAAKARRVLVLALASGHLSYMP